MFCQWEPSASKSAVDCPECIYACRMCQLLIWQFTDARFQVQRHSTWPICQDHIFCMSKFVYCIRTLESQVMILAVMKSSTATSLLYRVSQAGADSKLWLRDQAQGIFSAGIWFSNCFPSTIVPIRISTEVAMMRCLGIHGFDTLEA